MRFLDFLKSERPGASDEQMLTFPTQVAFDVAFKTYLLARGARLTPSTNEKGVFHVHVAQEAESAMGHDLCGVFHMLQGLVLIGFAIDNPMEIPTDKRQRKSLALGASQTSSAPTVVLKFRFRIPSSNANKMRTESNCDLPYILPALIDYGVPRSIELQTLYAIDACLRRFERISPSVWDHWNASKFGDVVFSLNKGDAGRRTKESIISKPTLGKILHFGESERQRLDSQGWKLSQWREYLSDPKVPIHTKRALAQAEPLLPTRKGVFISASGYSDHYYVPAMKRAGLVTRTHYTRHCGVHDFLDYVDSRTDLTADQRNEMRLAFGRAIGWAWPEVMLAYYSLPQRRKAILQNSRDWHETRDAWRARIAAGEFAPQQRPMTTTEPQLTALALQAIERFGANV